MSVLKKFGKPITAPISVEYFNNNSVPSISIFPTFTGFSLSVNPVDGEFCFPTSEFEAF